MGGRNVECCMCGDHGISSELFACIHCGFRSQHKYCSNLYPGAESYNHCNWCLTQNHDQTGEEASLKTTISSEMKKSKLRDIHSGDDRRKTDHHQHSQIKKQNKLPPPAARKRGTSDIVQTSIKKPVFRNKVRRYKLLEEVISN